MSVDLLVMSGGTGLSDKSTCNAFLPLSLKGSRRERREGAPVKREERGSGGEGRQRDSTPVMSGGTGLSDKSTCNAFLPLSLKGSRRERREGAPAGAAGREGVGG